MWITELVIHNVFRYNKNMSTKKIIIAILALNFIGTNTPLVFGQESSDQFRERMAAMRQNLVDENPSPEQLDSILKEWTENQYGAQNQGQEENQIVGYAVIPLGNDQKPFRDGDGIVHFYVESRDPAIIQTEADKLGIGGIAYYVVVTVPVAVAAFEGILTGMRIWNLMAGEGLSFLQAFSKIFPYIEQSNTVQIIKVPISAVSLMRRLVLRLLPRSPATTLEVVERGVYTAVKSPSTIGIVGRVAVYLGALGIFTVELQDRRPLIPVPSNLSIMAGPRAPISAPEEIRLLEEERRYLRTFIFEARGIPLPYQYLTEEKKQELREKYTTDQEKLDRIREIDKILFGENGVRAGGNFSITPVIKGTRK